MTPWIQTTIISFIQYRTMELTTITGFFKTRMNFFALFCNHLVKNKTGSNSW